MHEVLMYTKRHALNFEFVDTYFYGSIFHAKPNRICRRIGTEIDDICFTRSLAKPFQACVVFDNKSVWDTSFIQYFNITKSELAIFSGSHAGSPKHIQILQNVMEKGGLKNDDLLLSPMAPLDCREYNTEPTKLHNNCSGKHIMMALMCKYMGFSFDYCSPEHPLQKLIKQKQEDLTGYKSEILTFDGCSTPLWGLPYRNIIKGYFNLVHSKKYSPLIDAIMSNPEIYGGYDRLDSEIIELSNGRLFSKVGAGGLVLIYNFDEDEILLIKMAHDDNNERKIIALDALNKLGWLDVELDKYIYNQKEQIVAEREFAFNL